jgi:hypothetical protein
MCVFYNIFACRKQDNVPLTPFLTETRLICGVFLLHWFFNYFSETGGNWDKKNDNFIRHTLFLALICIEHNKGGKLVPATSSGQASPLIDWFLPVSPSYSATTQSSTPKTVINILCPSYTPHYTPYSLSHHTQHHLCFSIKYHQIQDPTAGQS